METMIGFIAGYLAGAEDGRPAWPGSASRWRRSGRRRSCAAWPGRRRASAESSSSRSAAAAWQAWSARSPAGWRARKTAISTAGARSRPVHGARRTGGGLTARRPRPPSGLASLGDLLIARIPPSVPGSQPCDGTGLVFPADTRHCSHADRQRDHARLEGAVPRETCHCRQPDHDHDHVLVVCRTRLSRWPAGGCRDRGSRHRTNIPRRPTVDRHPVPLPGRWARLV